MKKSALLHIAVLTVIGTILTTSSAQAADAQMLDILKSALGGQLPASINSNNYNDSNSNSYNNYGGSLNSAGLSSMSGILNSLLQSQYTSGYGGNLPANLSGNYASGFPGDGNFGSVLPVVFNGVALDSGIYSGPYRGSQHQVESAMNLDWAMTVLKEQINLGAQQGYLMADDASLFSAELNNLIAQKRQVVGRNGLSFQDSQVLVRAINDLVSRVRQAWYLNNLNGNGNGWGRRKHKSYAQTDAYGQILSPSKNQALENLYLITQPSAGFRH